MNVLDKDFADLDLRLFLPSAAHLPTILLLVSAPYSSSETASIESSIRKSLLLCKSAQLFCLYCDADKIFLPVDCGNAIQSAEMTISSYKNQIPWLSLQGYYYWKENLSPCPLTLGAPPNELCAAEYANIDAVVFSGMNGTISGGAEGKYIDYLRFPRIYSDSVLLHEELIVSHKELQ